MNIGDRIGDYEILGELGRGGMGRVFRVRNVIAERVEAMKVLLPDLAGRQDLAARFLREIKVLAALNHPNIAALRTALTAGNQLVMIMEYVEGQSLADRLARGPIAQADAIDYVGQVLDALAYAHGRGIVHRDIKPANMMLTPSGVVKLTDFGIARSATDETITVAGTTTGSLAYMAPEQVNGKATDARSDLYAVGISLYEMATGRRPFRADSDFHVMLAHLNEHPRPPIELQPSLSPSLNDIILRAIAKPPDERFQSADEFRQAFVAVPAGAVLPAAHDDLTRTAAGYAHHAPRPAPDRPPAPVDTPVSPAPPGAVQHTIAVTAAARQPAATRSGHPLLFVALGAVLVIVALVGTGLYLGRAEAGPDRATAPATVGTAADAPADRAAPAAATGADDEPVPNPGSAAPATAPEPSGTVPTGEPGLTSPAAAATGAATGTAPNRPSVDRSTPPPVPPSTATPVRSQAPPAAGSAPGTSGAGATAGSSAAPQPSPAPADAELDAIEAELDQLAVRASAVASSLNRLREQQARQGLGLRGDMVARLESMRINLSRAQEALDRGDTVRPAKFRDAARRDIEALERFLGQ